MSASRAGDRDWPVCRTSDRAISAVGTRVASASESGPASGRHGAHVVAFGRSRPLEPRAEEAHGQLGLGVRGGDPDVGGRDRRSVARGPRSPCRTPGRSTGSRRTPRRARRAPWARSRRARGRPARTRPGPPTAGRAGRCAGSGRAARSRTWPPTAPPAGAAGRRRRRSAARRSATTRGTPRTTPTRPGATGPASRR